MPFVGQAEVTIDAKQRLAIPAKFRQQVGVMTALSGVSGSAGMPGLTGSTSSSGSGSADGESEATEDGEARVVASWYCLPWAAGTTGYVLRLYPVIAFAELVRDLGGSLIQDRDDDDLETTLFSELEQLDQDASGRIRLPQDHLDLVGLPREVVVIGAGSKLEIHDRARWTEARRARFEQLPRLVAARKQAAARDGG